MPVPQALSAKLAAAGATYVEGSYVHSRKPFQYVCSCGEVVNRSWDSLANKAAVATCAKCSLASRSKELKVRNLASNLDVLDRIRAKCAEYGATPDLSNYSGSKEPFPVTCSCGTVFRTDWSHLRRQGHRATCTPCSYESTRRENSIHWMADKSDEDRAKDRSAYAWWPRKVLEAHDFTCAISGIRGKELAAHHLYNYGHYPEFRSLVCNGVALSRELHDEFHQLYGKGNNTLEQFQEFHLMKSGRPYINHGLELKLPITCAADTPT